MSLPQELLDEIDSYRIWLQPPFPSDVSNELEILEYECNWSYEKILSYLIDILIIYDDSVFDNLYKHSDIYLLDIIKYTIYRRMDLNKHNLGILWYHLDHKCISRYFDHQLTDLEYEFFIPSLRDYMNKLPYNKKYRILYDGYQYSKLEVNILDIALIYGEFDNADIEISKNPDILKEYSSDFYLGHALTNCPKHRKKCIEWLSKYDL